MPLANEIWMISFLYKYFAEETNLYFLKSKIELMYNHIWFCLMLLKKWGLLFWQINDSDVTLDFSKCLRKLTLIKVFLPFFNVKRVYFISIMKMVKKSNWFSFMNFVNLLHLFFELSYLLHTIIYLWVFSLDYRNRNSILLY